MPGLELLLGSLVIVDESESGRSSSSEDGLEAKGNNSSSVRLVHGGELLRELGPRDVGPVGVENVEDELLSGEQPVGDELPGTEGDGGVRLEG